MQKNAYLPDECTFAYILCSHASSLFSQHIPFGKAGDMHLSFSKATQCIQAETDTEQLFVLGLCVDAYAEMDRYDIPIFLLKNCQGRIEELAHLANRLAGNYVILYENARGRYAFTDAAACMQINYAFLEGKTFLSSHDGFLAKEIGASPSVEGKSIRQGNHHSTAAHPNDAQFPYDVTLYAEIKALLPNHYLTMNDRAYRYWPTKKNLSHIAEKDQGQIEEVIDASISLIDNIVKEYRKYHPLSGALTGGYDSRLTFSFLYRNTKDTLYYTFKHKGLTETSGDITVPRQIADDYDIPYHLIEDVDVTDDYYKEAASYLSSYLSRNSLMLAYTFGLNHKGRASINGNIIEQLGRKIVGRNAPPLFLSTTLYSTISYNHGPHARKQFETQIRGIKKQVPRNLWYELMNWENYCGRWTSQSMSVQSGASISSLNIYNCRSLLEKWILLPKKFRLQNQLYTYILQKTMPKLLEYPVNPDRAPVPAWKRSWPYHILSGHIHYYLGTSKVKQGLQRDGLL